MSNFEIRLNNRSYLTRQEFELTPGYSVTLKISGLHNKEHLMFKASNNRISLAQSADNKKSEQALKITAVSEGSSEVTSVTKGIGQCAVKEMTSKMSDCFPRLTFLVLPKIAIPSDLTLRQKVLVQVLLSETSIPQKKLFNSKEAKEAMTLMHDALYNRIASPKARYLDVPQDGSDKLLGVIFKGRVIEGFKNNTIDPKILSRISVLIEKANDGNPDMKKYRMLIQDAIEIAKKDSVISDYTVIGWRTTGSSLGGGGIEKYKDLQGQTFTKLTAEFLRQ